MSQSDKKKAWALMWAIYQAIKYDGGHRRKEWTYKRIERYTKPMKGKKRQ